MQMLHETNPIQAQWEGFSVPVRAKTQKVIENSPLLAF